MNQLIIIYISRIEASGETRPSLWTNQIVFAIPSGRINCDGKYCLIFSIPEKICKCFSPLPLQVHHVRSLSVTVGGQEPNTYVKTYLKPDPSKATKRKTKVVRRNCFPSFMETVRLAFPFRLPQVKMQRI